MSVDIREVSSKQSMKVFVQFANKMYEGNPYYCPTLDMDEYETFDPKKNPALEFCTYKLFLAYRGEECVGRIAGLINPKANEAWSVKKVRFGWFDFIDDMEVSHALLKAVEDWGKQQGMTELNGPVGFTDFDREGMLLRGYDQHSLMHTYYNYPYYVKHTEAYGMEKGADWLEYKCVVPKEVPERWKRVSDIAKKRSKLHVVKVKNRAELAKRYPNLEYFQVMSDAYSILYNYQAPTMKQMQYIADHYLALLNFDLITLVENENNEVVALGVGMPDISPALKKANGKMLPFGWYHLLKALHAKQFETLTELIIAVRPDYQDKGAIAPIFEDLIEVYNKYRVKYVETGPILELNLKNAANFTFFEHEVHKHRRAFTKKI